MSNNKQSSDHIPDVGEKVSSVDVLISGLLEYIHEAHHLEVLELYEQAKEMHKEEMCKFAYKCHQRQKVYGDFMIHDYYNETFNNDAKK